VLNVRVGTYGTVMPIAVSVDVLTVDELGPAVSAHFGSQRLFTSGPPPDSSGAYVWSSDPAVLYIGSAASLARRLGDYRKWIAGYDPESDWEVSVVHMLKVHQADVQWVTTSSHDQAKELERRLIEWHRACVGIAPLVVGWEAKADSPREAAERWARKLWLEKHGRSGTLL